MFPLKSILCLLVYLLSTRDLYFSPACTMENSKFCYANKEFKININQKLSQKQAGLQYNKVWLTDCLSIMIREHFRSKLENKKESGKMGVEGQGRKAFSSQEENTF